jgi:hypothetical protein
LAFGLFTIVALLSAGCGSNNTGKIVGKWKLTSPPSKTQKEKDEFEAMSKLGVFLYLEFKTDNSLVLGIDSDKPDLLNMLKKGAPDQKFTFEAKYKLLMGDKVEVYDVKDKELKDVFKGDKARSDILINGDDMTIKDPDGSITKLTKMK